MKITLTPEELKQCKDFSINSAKSQQSYEFGEKSTSNRPIEEIARDNLIGKIAEIAFATFLKHKFGIDVLIDFNIYPRGVWDSEDVLINGWKFDIKATRGGGKYLLVDLHKIKNRKKENKQPDFYILVIVDWVRNKELEKEYPLGTASIVGYISHKEMAVDKHFIPKKGLIPGTSTRLQTDNYCLHESNLNKNWDKLISLISQKEA